jgi:hypothetical protein
MEKTWKFTQSWSTPGAKEGRYFITIFMTIFITSQKERCWWSLFYKIQLFHHFDYCPAFNQNNRLFVRFPTPKIFSQIFYTKTIAHATHYHVICYRLIEQVHLHSPYIKINLSDLPYLNLSNPFGGLNVHLC